MDTDWGNKEMIAPEPDLTQIQHRPFTILIYPLRGIKPSWRVFAQCDTRGEADKVIAFHKDLDKRPPVGHYEYRVVDTASLANPEAEKLRVALALHHSMVLCGEKPSEQSEKEFYDAMSL